MELPTSAWRVKLYELKNEQWQDLGTGYCNGELVSCSASSSIEEGENGVDNDDQNEDQLEDSAKQADRAYLMVRNEQDQQEMLLKSQICGNIQYQKQQGTLIVWTDQEQSEMALSFQEPEGCSVICDFLVFIQENFEHEITILSVNTDLSAGNNNGYEVTELIAGPRNPPPDPELGSLAAVLDSLSVTSLSPEGRLFLMRYIHEVNYVEKLVALFKTAEERESLHDLHNLCRIIKLLFVMNDAPLYETLLDDANILGVVGMLEYDPEFPAYKANHRDYLSDESRFNEVVEIHDAYIRQKIIQTFRLQFMKDVALARVLDDGSSSLMASLIYYNQMEILSFIQNNKTFTQSLFNLYNEESDVGKQGGKRDFSTAKADDDHKHTENGNVSPDSDPDHVAYLDAQPPVKKVKLDSAEFASAHTNTPELTAEITETTTESPSSSPNTPKSQKSPVVHKDSEKLALLKKKRDGVRFIHHLTQMVKGFQQHMKSQLYSSLVKNGLLKLVRFALNDYDDTKTKLLGTELSIALVEHDPNLIKNAEGDLGIKILVDLFLNENDILLKSQAAEAIKIQWDASMGLALEEKLGDVGLFHQDDDLYESEDMIENANENEDNGGNSSENESKDQDSPKSVGSLGLVRKNGSTKDSKDHSKDSLQFERRIYKVWMPVLFQKLISLSSNPGAINLSPPSYADRITYEQLCDILAYCLNRHSTRSRAFVVQYNLWVGIKKLLGLWPYKPVLLAAIRCLKAGLDTMVGDYETNLLESGVLQAFLELMIRIGNNNNLLQSACLDLLEHVYRLSTPVTSSSSKNQSTFSFDSFTFGDSGSESTDKSSGAATGSGVVYDTSRSELFIFEWINRNKDLFEQLQDFCVISRLRTRYEKLVKESQEKDQEAQSKENKNNNKLSGSIVDEEIEDGGMMTSDDESTMAAAAAAATAAATAASVDKVDEEPLTLRSAIELGNVLKRPPSNVPEDDEASPPRTRQKLDPGAEISHVEFQSDGNPREVNEISNGFDDSNSGEGKLLDFGGSAGVGSGVREGLEVESTSDSSKKSFRRTLSTAGKKFTMSFKKKRKGDA